MPAKTLEATATISQSRFRFTLWHWFAVSLALHAALILPFVLHPFEEEEEITPLVLDLEGLVAENQTKEEIVTQKKGADQPQSQDQPTPANAAAATPPPPPPEPDMPVADDGDEPPPPPPIQAATEQKMKPEPVEISKSQPMGGAEQITGVEEQQTAQTIKPEKPLDVDVTERYVRGLSKKVQTKLVYPNEGRNSSLQGSTTVSFTILSNGQIRPESLQVIESSGHPELDTSALKTIRASLPFAPPPQEMTIAIGVAFGRKAK